MKRNPVYLVVGRGEAVSEAWRQRHARCIWGAWRFAWRCGRFHENGVFIFRGGCLVLVIGQAGV